MRYSDFPDVSFRAAILFLAIFGPAGFSGAADSAAKISRPAEGTFVADVHNLIDPVNEGEINAVLTSLQEEHGVTMYVVVVASLAKTGYGNAQVEDVARQLMEEWKVGPKTLDGKPWDRGVLILLDRDANKIQVETGDGWGTDLDRPALAVLQRDMIPHFSRMQYAVGLAKGVRSLDAAIRMQTPMRNIPPKVPAPKEEEFAVDTAGLFPLETKLAADKACRELYRDQGVPMFILTVKSIESISRKGLAFEIIAQRFFRFWPVEPEARRKAFQERGVLLFLSRDDNLIGMEFGESWGSRTKRDEIRQEIMNRRFLPALEARQLPQGVLNSIQGVREVAEQTKFVAPASPASAPVPANGAK